MPGKDESASARHRILDVALSMMSHRGVTGTSMRDLAGAVGLNVASLYHYFPSKRDLLLAVLAERGMADQRGWVSTPGARSANGDGTEPATGTEGTEAERTEGAPPPGNLTELLDEILGSMLEVEDFVRLMMGEVMRGEELARSVGVELYSSTQAGLEEWLSATQPGLVARHEPVALARALRAFLVGLFFEHVAGVLDEEGGDTRAAFHRRAVEMAGALEARLDS